MIVDANVLLYAIDEQSPFQSAAASWLESAFNGSSRVGLPWPTLLGFQRIVTHPHALRHPLSAAEAWAFVEDWLSQDQTWIPVPGPRHAQILGDLLVSGELRGKLVPDAHLAALAIENGVGVCSFDTDFARFPQLNWIRPN